jgi:tetratricopeptide (TPR) repeat protein
MSGSSSVNEFEASPLIREVREMLRRGAIGEASARVGHALAVAPRRADAWYLRGVVANRCRDHAAAVVALRRAIDLRPDAALPWLALGTALARSSAWREAVDAYREAIARDPAMADAHLNLGLALKQRGDALGAMRSLHHAWSCDPMLFDAARQCVATIAEYVQSQDAPAWQATHLAPAKEQRSFTIVMCSIDDAKCARAVALYRRLFADVPHELVVVRDAASLASAYNAAIATATGEFVLLSHDDVDVLDDDFAARIAWLLSTQFDALGVIGSTRIGGPAIGWSGHPHLRGWITHRAAGDPRWQVDVLDPRPTADGVVALDGVLIAARRDTLRAIPFDATTFDGFHLYDLDWSYRAAGAGFRLGVAGELLVVHASRGSYDGSWDDQARRFCMKHDVGRQRARMSSFFGATLDSAARVRAFFAVLRALAAMPGGTAGTDGERLG